MIKIPFLKIFIFIFLLFDDFIIIAQITVEKKSESWVLLIDNVPFNVKGATFGYDKNVEDYDSYFRDLQYLGVNTIRTWGPGSHTKQLLDAAHKYDIKVMLGIWMRHGRPGMEDDDHFDYLSDTKGKESMYEDALTIVEKYKDHPAILTWGIGNEVYLNIATDEEKLAYSLLLERVCSEIKKIDNKHPISSVEAWTFGLDWWSKYVPSIDIYGINTYGSGANILPEELAKKGIDKPYIITEFGVRGEWDIEKDKNGVKPEPKDAEKYETIVKGYNEWIKPKPNCLGVYVFHYATDNQFGAPWLLTHYRGMTRPQYWAIREAYTGQKPINNVPFIKSFQLPDTEIQSGIWIPVKLEAFDKEQEILKVNFYYNQRTGSRKRRDQIIALNCRGSLANGFEIQLPRENGGIKVYAAVNDTFNNVGIASTSISVIDQQESKRRFLVPRVEIPFYVYNDNRELPYIPSLYLGNYKDMKVDIDCKETVKSGETAIKISYNATGDWFGFGFVDPANDWGDILGGYNLSDTKTMSFWAKTNNDQLKVTAGFGLIEEGKKPFPDTALKRMEIVLTKEWKKYSINTKSLDLSCIRSGFILYSNGQGIAQEIYIDEIVFD